MVALLRLLVGCCLALFTGGVAAGAHSLEVQLPGFTHHFGSPSQPGRHWTDFHDGLGIQRTTRNSATTIRYTAGFMRDSFRKQGLYAGASFGYRLWQGEFEVDASLAPMVLYRTTRFDDERGTAPYKVIPVVMPLLCVEHRASGIGANLTVLPGGNFGKDLRFPGLAFLQITIRLR